MLIEYTISANPIEQATQITSIVSDYSSDPHNNILKLSFGLNTMWSKIPMITDTEAKRYKYKIETAANSALQKRFRSNYLGIGTNSISTVVATLVTDLVTFV